MKKTLHLRMIPLLALLLLISNMQVNAQAPMPFVTVIQPNEPCTEWLVGTTHLISWTDNFVYPVRIDLVDYTIPGSPTTTNITTAAEGSTYSWAIPSGAVIGNHYKIKVSSSVCGDCYMDVSNSEFKLVASSSGSFIHVEQPNVTGINWIKGETYLISWVDDHPGTMKIKWIKGTGESGVIGEFIEGSTFLWTIPVSMVAANDYKIKVMTQDYGDDLEDNSDLNFTISAPGSGTITVIQPSLPGITWVKGDSYLISWIDNITGLVDIDLYKGGVLQYNIASGVTGSSYVWLIPSSTEVANNYSIKIYSHSDPGSFDDSNNNFSIQAHNSGTTVTVLQPNDPGIIWFKGSTYLISWIDNVPGKMKVSLYKNGSPHSVLAENVNGSTYLWTIPNDGSVLSANDYTIRISSMNDGTIQDFSNVNFSIGETGAGTTITVLQPSVGGITWVKGNSYLISWIDDVPGPVNIKLYKGGSIHSTIADNVVGSTHVWDIPSGTTSDTDYNVYIFNQAGTVVGHSASDFSIQGTLPGGAVFVLQPNGGENWFIGNTYLISWSDNFAETVDIDLYTAAGVFKQIIAHNVEGSTYEWNTSGFPVGEAGDYIVMISNSAVPSVSDVSDDHFHLLCLPLVSIFPNPASNFATIRFDEGSTDTYTLTLTDRINMQLLTNTINTSETKEVVVPIGEIPNGVYFVNLLSDKSVISKKLIIQH